MIGGVDSVRGFTVMIATEGVLVWCAVTPTSACKHCQKCLCTVSTVPTRRFKNVESPEKTKSCFLRDRKPPQSGLPTESGQILPFRSPRRRKKKPGALRSEAQNCAIGAIIGIQGQNASLKTRIRNLRLDGSRFNDYR